MSSYVNINGKLQASEGAAVNVGNRAFRYGYGLFETMLVKNGRIRLEELHWKRLLNGLKLLEIHIPGHFKEMLSQEITRTIAKNTLEKLCRVRLQVSGGGGGMYDGDKFAAEYVIEVFPLEPTVLDLNEAGLVVGISDTVKHTGYYAHLKSCNALPYVMAAREAKRSLWNDALLMNEQGNVIESTIANLFWIKDGQIFTPPLSDGCVDGVMRQHLLTVLSQTTQSIHFHAGSKDILLEADAVFLTNAIRGIRWIGSINDVEFGGAEILKLHLQLGKSY